VSDSLADHRSPTLLIGIFGITALLLASLGLYGVLAYSVSQRTREIGIRIALGAQAQSIVYLVVGQGLRLTLLGLIIGFAASLGLSGLLRALLFGVSTNDPIIYIVIPCLLLAVALLACYLPARKATRVDPVIALRAE
jgi:ABC-type antimicrobial peptide transport system permease subunit